MNTSTDPLQALWQGAPVSPVNVDAVVARAVRTRWGWHLRRAALVLLCLFGMIAGGWVVSTQRTGFFEILVSWLPLAALGLVMLLAIGAWWVETPVRRAGPTLGENTGVSPTSPSQLLTGWWWTAAAGALVSLPFATFASLVFIAGGPAPLAWWLSVAVFVSVLITIDRLRTPAPFNHRPATETPARPLDLPTSLQTAAAARSTQTATAAATTATATQPLAPSTAVLPSLSVAVPRARHRSKADRALPVVSVIASGLLVPFIFDSVAVLALQMPALGMPVHRIVPYLPGSISVVAALVVIIVAAVRRDALVPLFGRWAFLVAGVLLSTPIASSVLAIVISVNNDQFLWHLWPYSSAPGPWTNVEVEWTVMWAVGSVAMLARLVTVGLLLKGLRPLQPPTWRRATPVIFVVGALGFIACEVLENPDAARAVVVLCGAVALLVYTRNVHLDA